MGRTRSLGRSALWAQRHARLGAAKTAEAALTALHEAADAVATASPGRGGGAVMSGLNQLSSSLAALSGGAAAEPSPSEHGAERLPPEIAHGCP